MKSKLERIKAILDEVGEQPEWEDISGEVEARADYNGDHLLIYLHHNGETFGVVDLNGFSFMSGCPDNFKVEPHFASGSHHDNGGRVTWFKVYKRN